MSTPEIESALKAYAEALKLLPEGMNSPEATVAILAIGLQESELKYRRQLGGGPGAGLWQFERGGGVLGVCLHASSMRYARRLATARGIPFTIKSCYLALPNDDVLAAGFARLLLYTDPAKLPALGAREKLYAYYIRTWRPGKPRPQDWPRNYDAALAAVIQP